MEKKRIEWIDAAKGFTMLLVILGHCFDGYISAGIFPDDFYWLQEGHSFIYSFHMPLFFIMSGFLFYYTYSNYSISKLKYKIFDILILYFMFSVVQISIQILMVGKINRHLNMSDIFYLPIYTVPPYWYLYVLAALYLISNVFFSKISIGKILVTFTICLFSTLFIHIDEFSLSNIAYYLFFFVFGGALVTFDVDLKKWEKSLLFILIGYLLLVNLNLNNYVYRPLIAFLLSIFVIICFANYSVLNTNKLFVVCEKYCLPIYLVHAYLTAGTRVIFQHLHIENIWIYIVAGMSLGVIIPIVVYKICMRFKSLEFIFKPVKGLQKIRFMRG